MFPVREDKIFRHEKNLTLDKRVCVILLVSFLKSCSIRFCCRICHNSIQLLKILYISQLFERIGKIPVK